MIEEAIEAMRKAKEIAEKEGKKDCHINGVNKNNNIYEIIIGYKVPFGREEKIYKIRK